MSYNSWYPGMILRTYRCTVHILYALCKLLIISLLLSTHVIIFGVQTTTSWRVGSEVLPASAQLLLAANLPETPRWLLSQARANDAKESLRQLFRKAGPSGKSQRAEVCGRASSSKFWFAEGERTVKLQLKLRKMIGTDQKQKYISLDLLQFLCAPASERSPILASRRRWPN